MNESEFDAQAQATAARIPVADALQALLRELDTYRAVDTAEAHVACVRIEAGIQALQDRGIPQ